MQKAVIYCRVSSDRQALEGHGIEGQESACLSYIKMNGYEYVRTFKDEGVSGALNKRQGIETLKEFLFKQDEEIVVVIDDIKRWARDVNVHWELRITVKSNGGRLESPNFKFEDTPEGEFIETIFAGAAQLERKQNRRQVISRQKARLERGYWPFDPPPGYVHTNSKEHGKLLIPDEPKASVIKEALEGFANDIFLTQKDVLLFLRNKGFYHRVETRKVYFEQVKRLLTRVIYTGYIEFDEWGVALRKGHHEPIISYEIYQKNQEKLFGKKKAKFTQGIRNEDFPLRGYLKCSSCDKMLTASWSTGRNTKYPKYRCNNRNCEYYSNGLNKAVVEEGYAQLLSSIIPTDQQIRKASKIALSIWNQQESEKYTYIINKKKSLADIELQIQGYLDRIVGTNVPSIIKTYENEIARLEKEKTVMLEEDQKQEEIVCDNFGTALQEVMQFVKSVDSIWQNGDYQTRLLVSQLCFDEKIPYDKTKGFGTAVPSYLFEFLGQNLNYVDIELFAWNQFIKCVVNTAKAIEGKFSIKIGES